MYKLVIFKVNFGHLGANLQELSDFLSFFFCVCVSLLIS